jgi:tripartite-type tricarboxylate transporter receptor subunit TctC
MKFKGFGTLLLAIGISMSSLAAASADPQGYPTRTVKIVVPYPAGGGADFVARLLADKVRKQWDQTVIIENRSGAGGTTGANAVVTSPPDGYTIFFSPSPVFSSAKWLYKNLPFDPETDLKPVTLVSISPNVLMVPEKLPVKNLGDLIAYAKKHPDSVTFASQGVGTTGHLTGAYLAQVADIPILHVPYRGAAPALNALVAGVVTMAWDGLSSARGLIAGGKVRAIAVASKKRTEGLPNVPTVIESGFKDFESASWYGVAVPKDTPDEIVQKLNEAFVTALKDPSVNEKLTSLGAEVVASTPAELAAYMKADSARWKKVIDSANIKIGSK